MVTLDGVAEKGPLLVAQRYYVPLKHQIPSQASFESSQHSTPQLHPKEAKLPEVPKYTGFPEDLELFLCNMGE
ncbi:hypothetical protein VE03_06077 [Pseudogymnoascus sp. 23342-1-I1]|nr:hypothetical protein VE03_06077 [Pseudogymnoascus sp. 23342-1-I1]